MKVKLVGYTQPAGEFAYSFSDAKELIAYCARVSNPSNQFNNETADKLIRYLIKHKHWSPMEMASATLEIETTRDIARQFLRHRSFSFQEFCITGDSMVTLELPNGVKTGKRSSYKRSIEHLYKLQQSGKKLPSFVRVFNEDSKTFEVCAIKEVFNTGVKPVYKVTLDNGKTIKTTKEHKFLTAEGFLTLEDAIGLEMKNNKAMMTKTAFFGCNGVAVYQSEEWMKQAKEESIESGIGVQYIADKASVSYHTIRKWLKNLNLQFTPMERSLVTEIWNKGKFGYKNKPHTMETIEKMRLSARKGSDSNLWRGGVDRSERMKIADWCGTIRSEKLIESDYKCSKCGSSEKLELHHIVPVYEDKSKAYDKDNITVLCQSCHQNIHKTNGDAKTWREKHMGNSLTVEWSKVVSVEFVGEEQTYDMEVDHISHNYVANGIVTHNSQRYANPLHDLKFEIRELRLQDNKNRQNSIEVDLRNPEHREINNAWIEKQQQVIALVKDVYTWAINNGVAKEQARSILPEGNMGSRMYVNGTIRSWIHYIEVRTDETTQKEHRELAKAIGLVISKIFPIL
jgi:thymidylate synthase (FAD)